MMMIIVASEAMANSFRVMVPVGACLDAGAAHLSLHYGKEMRPSVWVSGRSWCCIRLGADLEIAIITKRRIRASREPAGGRRDSFVNYAHLRRLLRLEGSKARELAGPLSLVWSVSCL